jgi:hypothetical protein
MVHQEVASKCRNSAALFLCRVLIVLSLTLTGCAAMEQIKPNDNMKAVSPGEKMIRTPEKTQEKYACASYRKAVLHLEDVQVLPEVVTPGKEINHRMRYVLCPFTPSGLLQGRITRTVLFKGKQLFRDTTNYTLKPGTWMVDVLIGIPPEAESGVYALDVTLRYDKHTLRESRSFIVGSR